MRKSRNPEQSRRKVKYNPVPLLIRITAVFLFLAAVVYVVCVFAKMSFFNVKEVKVRDNHAIDVPGLKGENIFFLDLRREVIIASRRYPQYSNIRILRILPDRVYVDFTARKPLASVHLDKILLVDENGFFFSQAPVAAGEPVPEFPLIEGLQGRLRLPVEGRSHSSFELRLALDLIKKIGIYPVFNDFKIKRIDLSHSGAVVTFLKKGSATGDNKAVTGKGQQEEGLQVKFGPIKSAEKVEILSMIFNQYAKEFSAISYIDLRFREPVIKLREVKTGA